ncbi:MAG: CNNM domain-containing protein [Verrucomicrobiota bacterium]|nr:CNNM domain-containing protein [Verrucomicrobiota bacterium]
MQAFLILLSPICIALSFLCAGMESGVFGLSQWRIREQVKKGRKRARVLNHFLSNPENFLWTILVGNTLSSVLLMTLLVTELYRIFSGRILLFTLSLLGTVFLYYALCDLLPKTLFRMFPNRLTLLGAVPFQALHLFLSPIVKVTELFSNLLLRWTGGKSYTGQVLSTRHEFRMVMDQTGTGLTSEEQQMIHRVLDLQQLKLRNLTVPFGNIPVLLTTTTVPQLLELSKLEIPTVLPVWEEQKNGRRVVGLIDLDELLYAEQSHTTGKASDYLFSPLYLNENLRVEEALDKMRRRKQRIAIVTGGNRQEVGFITIDQILRFIFGEIKP